MQFEAEKKHIILKTQLFGFLTIKFFFKNRYLCWFDLKINSCCLLLTDSSIDFQNPLFH